MSVHKSLVTKGKLVRARNVLKRAERIMELEKAGKWKGDENSPFGLPKVRVLKAKKRVKEKKKDEVVGATAEGAAPAAGAKSAAAGAKAPAAAPAGGKAPAAAKAPAGGKGSGGKEGKK